MKKAFTKKFLQIIMSACVLMIPVLVYSQPAPPPGSGGSGTSPDTPLGVPFDADLNLLFAAAGVVLAVFILRRQQRAKKINT